MKERAALIHADLQVISTRIGTTVRLQLPSLAAFAALGVLIFDRHA